MAFQDQISSLRLLLDAWLDGSIRSYGYIAGSETLKNFLKSASEVVVMHIREAAENQGIWVESHDSPAKAVELFGKMEVDMGMMADSHLEVSESSDHVNLVMHGCPYARVCGGMLHDLIKGNLPQGSLPCFRSEIYQSVIAVDTNQKSRYVLTQYAPGDHCTSSIEII